MRESAGCAPGSTGERRERTHLGRRFAARQQVVLLAVRVEPALLALLLERVQVGRLGHLLREGLLARRLLLLLALALLALPPPLLERPLGLGLLARLGRLCRLLGLGALLLDAGVLGLLARRVQLGALDEVVELRARGERVSSGFARRELCNACGSVEGDSRSSWPVVRRERWTSTSRGGHDDDEEMALAGRTARSK